MEEVVLPDEDTLVLQPPPQRPVALVGHGEDVWRNLSQMVTTVELHGRAVVQTGQTLVWVHCCQDRADVRLRTQAGTERYKHTQNHFQMQLQAAYFP